MPEALIALSARAGLPVWIPSEVLDSITWAHDRLPSRLQVKRRVRAAAIHPTCATARMGLTEKLDRTCEIGLQEITGAPYASFVLLLERSIRP